VAAAILRDEFAGAAERYGWLVGRFVIMPDHVHFFCAMGGRPEPKPLPRFMDGLKQWSAKRISKAMGIAPPIWQAEFFDHVLRTDESYDDKWRYVVENPVRAGLVNLAEEWPYAGTIHAL
jgi:REP element-mobilizing transposase RayT